MQKYSLITFFSLACVVTQVSAINISCVYNLESGVLEATEPWRNTLGNAADRACAEADGRRLSLNRSNNTFANPVPQSAANFVPTTQQSAKEIAYAKSSLLTGEARPSGPAMAGGAFAANPTDKTVMQLIARWATQAGYDVQLNNVLVTKAFPKHKAAYADVPLSKLKSIQPEATFVAALHGLRSKFADEKFDALVFEAVADPQVHTAYLQIYEKPSTKNKSK
jgi:hypothetical protein